MKLAAQERITLFNMLPNAGDITTIRALRVFKEELGLNEEESKSIGMKAEILPDGKIQTQWSPKLAEELPEKEIEMSGTITALIVSILQEMEKNKKIEEKHITLWDKFCA